MAEESEPESEPKSDESEIQPEEAARLKARISQLEIELSGKETELTALKQSRQEIELRLASLNDSLSKAVASYRSAVAQANPDVITELITGDSIESIDDSLSKAKELVSKVRRGVESEISHTRVPAGAPERTAPSVAGMSSREKIQFGIGKNNI